MRRLLGMLQRSEAQAQAQASRKAGGYNSGTQGSFTNNGPGDQNFRDVNYCETTDGQIGVCYGMMGNNLPSKREVVNLYRANNIRRMRLFDPNQEALDALRNSGIELMLGIPNGDLQNLAASRANAHQWAQRFVFNYYPSVNIKYIAVGNEVSPVGGSSWEARYVLPAIQNVYQAIRARGLHDQIKVSTAIDMTLIGNSYPPSKGSFRNDVRSYLDPIIGYLVYANAPLFVNLYPYFAYSGNPRDIALPYALFTSPNVVVQDGSRGYQNLFDAMLDSVHAALDNTRMGYVRVVVSESGWPSDGGEFAATYDNARTYLDNLIRHVNRGTPMRSGPIETYIFAMFDENQKVPDREKHFGLFYSNNKKKYPFGFGA